MSTNHKDGSGPHVPRESSPVSYHNLHITTEYLPRTSIFDLPYGYRVVCGRLAGWELLQRKSGAELSVEWDIVAGEYHENGLRLDVDGVVICDSLNSPECS